LSGVVFGTCGDDNFLIFVASVMWRNRLCQGQVDLFGVW
jgi:hypothetical protein